jgi:hypothetical protein
MPTDLPAGAGLELIAQLGGNAPGEVVVPGRLTGPPASAAGQRRAGRAGPAVGLGRLTA